MRKYEAMIILKNDLEEEARKNLISSLLDVLTSNGAKVGKVDEWGSRELAYEVNFEKRGYYVVIEYDSDNTNANFEFERICGITANVIRHIVVAKPE